MNEIKVVVQDAIISIEEQAKVEQQVNEIAKKFSNYLPTADTLPADRATRAELRKVTKTQSMQTKDKELEAGMRNNYTGLMYKIEFLERESGVVK